MSRSTKIIDRTLWNFMSHPRTKMWKQAPEEWAVASLAQWDKTINKVKLTVKFYSLLTSIRVVARVDVRTQINGNLHAKLPHANAGVTMTERKNSYLWFLWCWATSFSKSSFWLGTNRNSDKYPSLCSSGLKSPNSAAIKKLLH